MKARHSTETPSPLSPEEVTAEFEQLERDKRDGLLCPRLVHNPSSPCSCYVKTEYTGPTHTLTMATVYCDLHDSRKLAEHAVRLSAENARLREALAKLEGRITQAAHAFYVVGKPSALRMAFDGWKNDATQARAALASKGEADHCARCGQVGVGPCGCGFQGETSRIR